MLSWLSRPLSGCLGPVPLAQGVGRKAQLRSHMVSRFLVFLYTTHFFHDFVFPASRGGSKGGPGAILKHLWDPPEAQNGPLEGPFSAPSTPHTYLYAFSRLFVYRSNYLWGNCSMDLTLFLKCLFPGLAECAERLNKLFDNNERPSTGQNVTGWVARF